VNSYRDLSHGADAQSYTMLPLAAGGSTGMSRGFTTIYRKREGGLRFADLLDRLSAAAPEVRFRFTSPHPKDFPDELLALMKERPNICKVRSNASRAERPRATWLADPCVCGRGSRRRYAEHPPARAVRIDHHAAAHAPGVHARSLP